MTSLPPSTIQQVQADTDLVASEIATVLDAVATACADTQPETAQILRRLASDFNHYLEETK